MIKQLFNGVLVLYRFTRLFLFYFQHCSLHSNIASLLPTTLEVRFNTPQTSCTNSKYNGFLHRGKTQSITSIPNRLDGKFLHNILTMLRIALPLSLTRASLVSSFPLLLHSLVWSSKSKFCTEDVLQSSLGVQHLSLWLVLLSKPSLALVWISILQLHCWASC